VSNLLNSPEAKAMKAAGRLVGDRQVVELLVEVHNQKFGRFLLTLIRYDSRQALLRPEYEHGVIVDGFPRTSTQAECIKLLFEGMHTLRRKYEVTY
jgi:adenylate kinase